MKRKVTEMDIKRFRKANPDLANIPDMEVYSYILLIRKNNDLINSFFPKEYVSKDSI